MRIAQGQARAERSLCNGLAVTTMTAAVVVSVALLIGNTFLDEPGTWLLVLLAALWLIVHERKSRMNGLALVSAICATILALPFLIVNFERERGSS